MQQSLNTNSKKIRIETKSKHSTQYRNVTLNTNSKKIRIETNTIQFHQIESNLL